MRYLILIILSMLSALSNSATQSNVTIQTLMMDTSANKTDRLFIQTNVPRDSAAPECQTSGRWSFVLPLQTDHQNRMYSMLLAASAAGEKLTLLGTGLCDSWVDIETLYRIEVHK